MRRLLAAAAFALLAASAAAQTPIVNIQEVDEDGNQIALTDKSRIVDINSTLNLTIDRAALNNYLEQKGLTGSASDLVARIDTLTAVLQREDASLQQLQKAFANAPGASTPDMAQIGKMEVVLKLLPLLSRVPSKNGQP